MTPPNAFRLPPSPLPSFRRRRGQVAALQETPVPPGEGPLLVAVCGLPGAGKSSLAAALAERLGLAVVGVDPLEAALVRAGIDDRQPKGQAAYLAAETVAEAQLRTGLGVVVDAVNDLAENRSQWVRLATRTGADLRWIEVVCSDPTTHRLRLQQREREEDRFIGAPEWDSLNRRRRQLAIWKDPRLVLDSLHHTPDELAALAVQELGLG
jgi:predicted kinase